METCSPLYVSSEYISSESTKISLSIHTSAISSKSFLSNVAPVGLFGKGKTSSLVLSVIFSKISSLVSLKLFSSFNSIGTGFPYAN